MDETRTVYYADSGRIRTGFLVATAEFQSVVFPPGSILGFTGEGLLWRCRLGADTQIQNFPCMGDREIEFHPNGNIASCFLSVPARVSGCLLKEGALAVFHESRELFRGVLRADHVRQGYRMVAGTELCLFEDGRIASFQAPPEGVAVNGLRLARGTRVWFHPDGRLRAGTLSEACVRRNVECAVGSRVWFHENGGLAGCATGESTVLLDREGKGRSPGRDSHNA